MLPLLLLLRAAVGAAAVCGGGLGCAHRAETPPEAGQRPDMGVNTRAAQVFQQVIVEVGSVQGRLGRKDLVQVGEVVVDKMRERLRWVHA